MSAWLKVLKNSRGVYRHMIGVGVRVIMHYGTLLTYSGPGRYKQRRTDPNSQTQKTDISHAALAPSAALSSLCSLALSAMPLTR